MPASRDKLLLFVLDALGSIAGLITLGMLALMLGTIGAFLGHVLAWRYDLPDSLDYGAMVVGALLFPVWLGLWLWQRVIRPDDDPPPSAS